ncbi:Uncharacterised protein [Mycobacteroides abscessus subsp. abscessus]|nr:Uncharacterised protein [Mycobacteroides abscessus subsp. abscessus]
MAVLFVGRAQRQRGVQAAVRRQHDNRTGVKATRVIIEPKDGVDTFRLRDARSRHGGKQRLQRIHPRHAGTQLTTDCRSQVLNTATLTHGHEVGNLGTAGINHLGDLSKRASY